MATAKDRFLALLATGRVANLPTVLTHVGVGMMLTMLGNSIPFAHSGLGDFPFHEFLIYQLAVIAVLGSLFYFGGCLLGDGADAEFDLVHRPERPIPRGILSARAVSVAGYICICLAWVASCLIPAISILVVVEVPLDYLWQAVMSGLISEVFSSAHLAVSTLLAIAILCYAKFHKRMGILAPVLMALCRSLLVIWAAGFWFMPIPYVSLGSPLCIPVGLFAIATFVYTLCLSLVARNESQPDSRFPACIRWFFLAAPPLILSFWIAMNRLLLGKDSVPLLLVLILACAILLAWSIHALALLKRSIPKFVSAALAGFCLLDATFGALVSWQASAACLVFFVLALLLQRVAPAT